MAGATTEIHQAAFGQQNDALSVRENHVVNLRLDFFPGAFLQRHDIDFIVKVTDVANDGLVFHGSHVRIRDDVFVAGSRYENIALVSGVFHRHHLVAFHGGLQGVDRVNLSDPHLGAQGAQGLGRALAYVAVASHHADLAGNHDVGGALDSVDQ